MSLHYLSCGHGVGVQAAELNKSPHLWDLWGLCTEIPFCPNNQILSRKSVNGLFGCHPHYSAEDGDGGTAGVLPLNRIRPVQPVLPLDCVRATDYCEPSTTTASQS